MRYSSALKWMKIVIHATFFETLFPVQNLMSKRQLMYDFRYMMYFISVYQIIRIENRGIITKIYRKQREKLMFMDMGFHFHKMERIWRLIS